MPFEFLFSSRPSTITTRSQPTRRKKKRPPESTLNTNTLSRSGRVLLTWTHKKVLRYSANLTATVIVSSAQGAPRNEGLQPYLFLCVSTFSPKVIVSSVGTRPGMDVCSGAMYNERVPVGRFACTRQPALTLRTLRETRTTSSSTRRT